ncbi:PHP-associated domain-containing protein [Haloarculaceae archaeon H-GB1-1]|nr:PHP-associated domain-containing protein [Haloarculaceae archaeon H-GB1-1]
MSGGKVAEPARVDLHVKILDERVVDRAKRRGLDVLVYAPHFERLPRIQREARRYSDEELVVVPAREVFTGDWRSRRHVLAIGLDEPVPDFITLEAAMAEFERQGAAVLVPHPEFLNVSVDEQTMREFGDVVDAVETYNPKHWPHHNRRARAIAAETDTPAFTSSYAHLHSTVGEAWTEFDRRVEEAADLVAALRDGAPRRVRHRPGTGHRLRCALEFAHLGYENSWSKFDRLVLSGMEPTHPDQPAYDGRFDDVSCY